MNAKDDGVCKWPKRSEKMTRSVDTLKELYTVAVGVALVMAVEQLAKESAGGPEHVLLFLVLAVTLIPFYHGAFRHMDDVYIFQDKGKPDQWVLLVDYLLLMVEAGLLVWLATSISNAATFTKGFVFLLAVDVGWAVLTGKLTPEKEHVLKWGVLNAVTVVILVPFVCLPCLAPIRASYLFAIALVRSVLDYWVSRNMYFPED